MHKKQTSKPKSEKFATLKDLEKLKKQDERSDKREHSNMVKKDRKEDKKEFEPKHKSKEK